MDELKHVTIYTDGACIGNPGPGGYGVVLLYGGHRKELSGGFALTTNNRMEIMAAIVGLEALNRRCRGILHSDSQYLVKAMTEGWARRWQAKGWWRTKEQRASNADLWERLLAVCARHEVEFAWVRGHAGDRENERCDELSCQAASQRHLPIDEGYSPPQRQATEWKARTTREGELWQQEKITHEGQPCRKCATPVVRRTPRPRSHVGRNHYYEYYLYCPTCKTMYLVEEAKKQVTRLIDPLF